MIQLTPIQLDDGTIIYIESNSDVDLPPTDDEIPGDEEEEGLDDKGISPEKLGKQLIQHAQVIENTIRAYTIISLNAFKKHAVPDVNKVILEFGIELGGEGGVPYVTKGTVKSNLKVTVECSPRSQAEDSSSYE